jgi:hypothetical protein
MVRAVWLIPLFIACLALFDAVGQTEEIPSSDDSTYMDQLVLDTLAQSPQEIETDTLRDRPNTAALLSAALPGLGQFYNKKYWKLPILYGGGVVIAYYLNYNNRLYLQYRNSLIALKDGDDRTQPHDPRWDESDLERATDYWRRNRDLLIIAAILVYGINIVDAHVDAHLDAFTISDSISLKIEPSIDQMAMNRNLYGVSFKFYLQ